MDHCFHIVVTGCGAYLSGLDVKLAGLVPELKGFDSGVYKDVGKRQLFRMFGASKFGEDRPFRLVVGDQRFSLAELMDKDPERARTLFRGLLIQASAGEATIEVKRPEAPVVAVVQG